MSENGVSDVAEVGISNGHAPNGIVNGGGDEGDARGFGSGTGPFQGFHLTKTAEADAFYSMNYPRRGKALIFNQMYFDSKLNLGQRHGTNADRDRLQTLFESLEFEVKVHNDLMYKDLARIVEDAADEDHSNSSCFVLCFLSHGEQGVLFAKDRQFKPDILWEKFSAQHCPSLAGKPKMFFIQACQGDRLDEGVHLVHRKEETDAPAPLYKIPAYADFLIAYSTVPGFFSWRNTTNGSWFIQALSYVLQIRDPAKEDLMSLITEASRVVATQFESNCPGQPHMHAKKQVPFITMTLTRKILLTPLKSSSGEREPRKNSEPEATDDVQQKPKKRKKSSWNPLKTCSCI